MTLVYGEVLRSVTLVYGGRVPLPYCMEKCRDCMTLESGMMSTHASTVYNILQRHEVV